MLLIFLTEKEQYIIKLQVIIYQKREILETKEYETGSKEKAFNFNMIMECEF